ncbi:MAG: prolipoprotein diacylglyceryl transferase, partial [Xanthomonadales bacterium]|nr:prolipoprotein diacylglyceryl transferase [Xanthomonadales bacterium]
FGWVTMGQLQSLPLVIVGLVLLWLSRRAPVLEPQQPPVQSKEEKPA